MTTIADETLMAYADGELAEPERARVERALAADAALGARVAALQAQRGRLAGAYAAVLDEPVPASLQALLAPPVADLAAERARRRPAAPWWAWGGMAASLAVGVVVGLRWDGGGSGDATGVAGEALGRALTTQLAGDDGPLRVVLSYRDGSGRYCRAFTAGGAAGLACRDGETWALQTIAAAPPAPAGGGLRPAATALPAAVLEAVDRSIAGPALDGAAERDARAGGWRRQR